MAVDPMQLALMQQMRQRPRQSASSRLAEQLLAQAGQQGPVYGTLGVASRALPGILGAFMAQRGQDEERVDRKQEFGQLQDMQLQQNEEAASFFGRGAAMPQQATQMPAQPDMMPPGGGVTQEPLPPPTAAVAPPAGMYGRNAPMAAQRDAMLGADLVQLAAASAGRMPEGQPQFNPARPGADAPVPSWDAGLAPPTGRINPNVAPPTAAVAPPAGITGLPPGVTMEMLAQGLAHPNPQIRQQAAAMVQVAQLARRETPNPVTVAPGASLVDPRTGRPIFTAPERPQQPDELQRLLALSGVQLNSPEAQQLARQILERRGQPPQTNVNVDNRAENALIQADGRALTAIQEGAGQARTLMQLFDRAEQAVRASPEGAGSQFAPILGQAARTLGFDLPGTSEAEVLRSITNQLAALQRIPGSGATSNMEMQLYMQAVPRLGNTREGNLALLDMGRRLMRRRIEEANLFRQGVGQPDLYDRLNNLPPIFSEEERQMLAGAPPTMGGMMQGVQQGLQGIQGPAPGMTATPPAAPQQGAPRVIEFDAQGRRVQR